MSTRSSKDTWSAEITARSDALDLDVGVIKGSPTAIAASLKRSAEQSPSRKSGPYGSAMSTPTFYIDRAGDNLTETRRRTLEAAEDKLRVAFGRKERAGAGR